MPKKTQPPQPTVNPPPPQVAGPEGVVNQTTFDGPLTPEQRAIIEDASAWRIIEKSFANNYGQQIHALELQVAALQKSVRSLSAGGEVAEDVRVEMHRRLKSLKRDLHAHVRQVVEAGESGSVTITTVDEVSGRVTNVQNRLDELIAGKILIQTGSKSGVTKEVDARLDALQAEITRVEKSLTAEVDRVESEFKASMSAHSASVDVKLAALEKQLEGKITAVSNELDAKFARLEARISTLETKYDENVGKLEASVFALSSQMGSMEERVFNRVSTRTVELNFSKYERKVTDLELRLSERIDDQSDDVALRFQSFNRAWLHYNEQYSAWVRAQLRSLKGCITDREVLHRLLVEMAARIEVTHNEAPCIIEEIEHAPGWGWSPPDLSGIELDDDGPHQDGPSQNG